MSSEYISVVSFFLLLESLTVIIYYYYGFTIFFILLAVYGITYLLYIFYTSLEVTKTPLEVLYCCFSTSSSLTVLLIIYCLDFLSLFICFFTKFSLIVPWLWLGITGRLSTDCEFELFSCSSSCLGWLYGF